MFSNDLWKGRYQDQQHAFATLPLICAMNVTFGIWKHIVKHTKTGLKYCHIGQET